MNTEAKILNPDYLAKEREEMQKNWIKKAFYSFIKNLFRQKTTFEKYGLLIGVLQVVSIACSYISYVTGRAFIETYLGAWVKDPAAVFWAAVGLIVLLEAVKMLSSMPLFLSIVRLSGFRWGAASLVALTFAFSMYISYEGAEDKVLKGAAPTLINTGEINEYWDAQILAKQGEKEKYLNGPEYRNSKGEIYHKVLKGHVAPLSAEIDRLTALRDEKVKEAESKNAAIESKHNEYTTADAATMAWIALGADGVKLIISLLTAWFFVASAKDYEIINDDSKDGDKFGKSEFGLLEALPVTEAKKDDSTAPASNDSKPQPRAIGFNKPPENKTNTIELIEFSKDSKVLTPSIVVKGFNKGQPLTAAELEKRLRDTKSRIRAINAGSKKHGTIQRAKLNLKKLTTALNTLQNG